MFAQVLIEDLLADQVEVEFIASHIIACSEVLEDLHILGVLQELVDRSLIHAIHGHHAKLSSHTGNECALHSAILCDGLYATLVGVIGSLEVFYRSLELVVDHLKVDILFCHARSL